MSPKETYRMTTYPDTHQIRVGAYRGTLEVGRLRADTRSGMVDMIYTLHPYRRLGIASRLYLYAQREYRVIHSPDRTRAGQAWALSLPDGGKLPPWSPI